MLKLIYCVNNQVDAILSCMDLSVFIGSKSDSSK